MVDKHKVKKKLGKDINVLLNAPNSRSIINSSPLCLKEGLTNRWKKKRSESKIIINVLVMFYWTHQILVNNKLETSDKK